MELVIEIVTMVILILLRFLSLLALAQLIYFFMILQYLELFLPSLGEIASRPLVF